MKNLCPIIETRLTAIEAACRQNGIQALWLFGSATRPDFNVGQSDVDFLVQLASDHSPASQFFGLYRSLAEIFDERIDLLSIGGITNPLLRREIEHTRIPLYVAS